MACLTSFSLDSQLILPLTSELLPPHQCRPHPHQPHPQHLSTNSHPIRTLTTWPWPCHLTCFPLPNYHTNPSTCCHCCCCCLPQHTWDTPTSFHWCTARVLSAPSPSPAACRTGFTGCICTREKGSSGNGHRSCHRSTGMPNMSTKCSF